MTKQEFDSLYSCFKLANLLAENSTNQVRKLLKTFSCAKNADVQDFLHNKAITFERNLRSCTYLYMNDESKSVSGYFSIGITYLLTNQLDKAVVKFLDGYTDETIAIPCYLVGQLGKSDECKGKIGSYLLDEALNFIDKAQDILKGRFVLIDAVNEPKVLEFYKQNSFVAVENSTSNKSIKMVKPYFEYDEFKI